MQTKCEQLAIIFENYRGMNNYGQVKKFNLGIGSLILINSSCKTYAKLCEQLKIIYKQQILWFQVLNGRKQGKAFFSQGVWIISGLTVCLWQFNILWSPLVICGQQNVINTEQMQWLATSYHCHWPLPVSHCHCSALWTDSDKWTAHLAQSTTILVEFSGFH